MRFLLLLLLMAMAFAVYGTAYLCKSDGPVDGDGHTPATAFNEDTAAHYYTEHWVAGDVLYCIDGGTYEWPSIDASGIDGTTGAANSWIGIKGATTHHSDEIVFSDWSIDTSDCPYMHFAARGTAFLHGDNFKFRNFNVDINNVNGVNVGSNSLIENCKINQDTSGASSAAFCITAALGVRVYNCELVSANGNGIYSTSGDLIVKYSYFNGITNGTGGVGILMAGNRATIENNIFNTRTGVSFNTRFYIAVENNIFYANATAISGSTGYRIDIVNNSFVSCTLDDIKISTQSNINFVWNNHSYDFTDRFDGVDEAGVHQDFATYTGDPLLTTPGSNYKPTAASPLRDHGYGLKRGITE